MTRMYDVIVVQDGGKVSAYIDGDCLVSMTGWTGISIEQVASNHSVVLCTNDLPQPCRAHLDSRVLLDLRGMPQESQDQVVWALTILVSHIIKVADGGFEAVSKAVAVIVDSVGAQAMEVNRRIISSGLLSDLGKAMEGLGRRVRTDEGKEVME